MKNILDRLKAGEILFCDGAMGTQLQERGLEPGTCMELWNLDHPDEVKAIHQAYADAGSDMIETNSFSGNSYKLKHFGFEDRVAELNIAAARLAREVAGGDRYVLGSMGSTGEFMAPLGLATEEEFIEAYAVQAGALEKGGVDAAIIETMTAVEEACAGIKAIKVNTSLVAIASFTFDPGAGGGYATMMGVTPQQAAEQALSAGADIIGANCGTGPDHMIEIVKLYREAASDAFIAAMPNAGMPVVEDGKTVFKETPEQMAERVPRLVDAGANIIGGCCGTTPDHIQAMREAVG